VREFEHGSGISRAVPYDWRLLNQSDRIEGGSETGSCRPIIYLFVVEKTG
jgi:hypothetical protein